MTLLRLLLVALATSFSFSASAAETYKLTLKDHVFTPSELVIPADTQVKITVKNVDSTSAEFESSDLNREKVVDANSSIIITVGPLKAGSYTFEDEFHDDTAKGTITVK